ncbi:MAG: hypothetical protein MdMp014T_1592 [Treponematales bacterium]
MSTGKDLGFMSDEAILGIKSPRSRIGGPYCVVYKDVEERFAIVALDWDGKPRLGIRWFWGSLGVPASSGYPV